jgi:hypothetical protein
MLGVISFMFTFGMTEHLALRYASGLRIVLTSKNNFTIQKSILTVLHLVLSGIASSTSALFVLGFLDMEFLMMPLYAFFAYYMPLLVKKILQAWFLESDEWLVDKHYSWAAGLVLMYTVVEYRLDPLLACVASLVAATVYLIVCRLYLATMQRLSYEKLPKFLRPLPLAFLVLGIFSMAFAALDTVFADFRVLTQAGL